MTYTIHKCNHLGEIELTYTGTLIERHATRVCIKARFKAKTRDLGYIVLKEDDIFTEWFYSNQWFNIFRVEDVDTGDMKGFYCNITRPASIHDDYVAADDLALDVFVKPNGETLLLDEDEYDDLPLSDDERQHVKQAVDRLYQWVAERITPFDVIP